jgi:esterase/lipase superfamily enzyme
MNRKQADEQPSRPAWRRCRMAGVFLAVMALLPACGSRGRMLMPRPNLYANAAAAPFEQVPPALRDNRVDVLYVTDRQPNSKPDGTTEYTSDRSYSMAFGSCIVEIGDGLSWETLVDRSLESPRLKPLFLSINRIEEHGRFPATPLPLVRGEAGLIEDPDWVAKRDAVAKEFGAEIAGRLARTPRKEAYVFIHGYNNRLPDGAFAMAELWHFMGRGGVPVIFSWPAGSAGLLRGYTHDRESGEFAIFHLKEFLRLLASCPELTKIHILMHSRGTDVGSSALRELIIETRAAGKDPRAALKLGNVVLAAPDLDLDVATQRVAAERVPLGVERMTVYVSHTDRMIGLAALLFTSARRVGQMTLQDLMPRRAIDPKAVSQVCIVEARVKTDFKGHSYFRTNPAASSDVILTLRDGKKPGAENGRPLIEVDRAADYWLLRDGYPSVSKN